MKVKNWTRRHWKKSNLYRRSSYFCREKGMSLSYHAFYLLLCRVLGFNGHAFFSPFLLKNYATSWIAWFNSRIEFLCLSLTHDLAINEWLIWKNIWQRSCWYQRFVSTRFRSQLFSVRWMMLTVEGSSRTIYRLTWW